MKVSAWIDWQSYAGGGTWETIRVDKNSLAIVPARRCYMQAAFGRFIRPGSQIIESNDSNTLAALVWATGNLVLVVRNGLTSSRNYTFDLSRVDRLPPAVRIHQYLVSDYKTLSRLPDIVISDKQFGLTAPPQSISTCVIPGVIDPVATAGEPAKGKCAAYCAAATGGRLYFGSFLIKGAIKLPENISGIEVYSLRGKRLIRISIKGNGAANLGPVFAPLHSSEVYYLKYSF